MSKQEKDTGTEMASAHATELHDYLVRTLCDNGFPCEAHEAEMSRLANFLSFVPGNAVLRSHQCPPSLRHHRIAVLHGPGVLRALTTGYVGIGGSNNESGGPRAAAASTRLSKAREEPNYMLTVVTPNLLTCGTCLAAACHVEYSCEARRAGLSIDEEMQRSAAAWFRAYG